MHAASPKTLLALAALALGGWAMLSGIATGSRAEEDALAASGSPQGPSQPASQTMEAGPGPTLAGVAAAPTPSKQGRAPTVLEHALRAREAGLRALGSGSGSLDLVERSQLDVLARRREAGEIDAPTYYAAMAELLALRLARLSGTQGAELDLRSTRGALVFARWLCANPGAQGGVASCASWLATCPDTWMGQAQPSSQDVERAGAEAATLIQPVPTDPR